MAKKIRGRNPLAGEKKIKKRDLRFITKNYITNVLVGTK